MEFFKVFVQIIRGKHTNSKNVVYGQGTSIQIEAQDSKSHIDGEPLMNNILDIRVIPRALKVLVPAPMPEPAFEQVYLH